MNYLLSHLSILLFNLQNAWKGLEIGIPGIKKMWLIERSCKQIFIMIYWFRTNDSYNTVIPFLFHRPIASTP